MNPILLVLTIYFVLAIIFAASASVYLLYKKRTSLTVIFACSTLCLIIYLFGYLAELNSTTLEQMLFWNQIQYIALPFFPGLWLLLSLVYTKKQFALKPLTLVVIFLIPVITFFFRLTNSYHHLYYSQVVLDNSGAFPLMQLFKGPWYIVQSVYIVVCILGASYIYMTLNKKAKKLEKVRLAVIISGSVILAIAHILQAMHFAGLDIDYVAFFCPISSLVLLISIFRFDFLVIKPLAREKIFESTEYSVIVLNLDYTIIDYNISAASIFSQINKNAIGKSIGAVLGEYKDLMDAIMDKDGSRYGITIYDKTINYHVSTSVIYNDYCQPVGYIVTISDVTNITQMMQSFKESQERYKALLDANPDIIFMFSYEGIILDYKSNTIAEIPVGFLNKSIYEVLPFDAAEITKERLNRLKETGLMQTYEYQADNDGPKYFEARLVPLGEDASVAIIRDITEQKETEYLLQSKQKILSALTRATNELIVNNRLYEAISRCLQIIGEATLVDKVYYYENNFRQSSDFFSTQKMLEWNFGNGIIDTTNSEVVRIPLQTIEKYISPISRGIPYKSSINEPIDMAFKSFLSDSNILSLLILPVMVENEFYGLVVLQESKKKRVWKDEEVSILVSFANSIAGAIERKDFERRIEYLSFHDQLTGLYNRRFFEEEVNRLDTLRNIPISLIMADLNALKLANDAFGHTTGDRMLVKAAEVIKAECRIDDIICRQGGDEFMILLPRTPSSDAENIVKRMREAVAKENADPLILSVSFGWDTKNDSEEDIFDVFKRAEENMYRHKLMESASLKRKTIDIIMQLLYEKKEREKRHSERVSKYCKLMAEALKLREKEIEELRLAGLMHDIGKIAIENDILNKAEILQDFERFELRRHSEIGYRILSSVNEFSKIADIILSHHERWDGKGYPKLLSGDNIPIGSRIIAIADAYEAMTSDRPYRKALTKEEVIDIMSKDGGAQFDPELTKVFIDKVLNRAM